jgi:arginase
MNTIDIISANCNQGQTKIGVMNGPVIISNIINEIINNKISVRDSKSDLDSDSDLVTESEKLTNDKLINNTIIPNKLFDTIDGYNLLFNSHLNMLSKISFDKKSNPVITLGGDHSIGHSTVSSSLSKFNDDLLVIWIDAHADINTRESSISKNTHGMPVSGLIRLEDNWISNSIPILRPENLIYFGIRDLDLAEIDFIKNLGIRSFMHLDGLTKYLDEVDITNKKIHISFDIDSLDPSYLNSTGTLAKEGLKPSDIVDLYKYVQSKTNIVALDIVELNPELGDLELSKCTLQKILEDILV